MKRTNSVWMWGSMLVAMLLLLTAPLVLGSRPYVMHIAIVAFFYAILASSWSLLAGYAGQFSFAHMAFMAIGAYGAGLFSKFVRLTTAPTLTCTEMPLGKYWLVLTNAYGDSCLQVGRANMPLGTLIYRLPAINGIVVGTLLGEIGRAHV